MMRTKRIVAFDICHTHPAHKSYDTDSYYVKLANKLLDCFDRAHLDLGEASPNIMRYAAISLASYMEDVVADSGAWRMFSSLCQQMFGQPVPLYHDPEEDSCPDEPSLMAVRYLVWNAACEMDDIWWHVDNPELEKLARIAYEMLDETFEEAPINELLATDIDEMLDRTDGNFDKLRVALTWIYSSCYLTRSENAEKLLLKMQDDAMAMKNMIDHKKRLYFSVMRCIFAYKVGPLALYSKDYIAALMRVKGKDRLAQQVADIEVLPLGSYRYTISTDGQTLNMVRTDGRTLDVPAYELNMSDKLLRQHNACVTSFVSYQGTWRMNGAMIPLECSESQWEGMRKNDPANLPEGTMTATPDMLLKQTDGREMLFFENPSELRFFLKTKMKHTDSTLGFLNHLSNDNEIMLFIDKGDPTHCLQFTTGFTPCIAAPDNPFYDDYIAHHESIEMLWNDDSIGTGAMLWLLERNYLPDLFVTEFFPYCYTPEEKKADASFLLRYMRRERY